MAFETKNSWDNITHNSWFIRENKEDKVDYTLIPTDMLKRVAELYTRGAKIYWRYNWANASGEEELLLYKQSAFRHFIQWQNWETDEDHMAAVVFNLFWYEFCRNKSSCKNKNTVNKEWHLIPVKPSKEYDWGMIDLDYGETKKW